MTCCLSRDGSSTIQTHPSYVKTAAREVLAAVGETADLERFEQDFAEAESDLQQAEMVCLIRRVERQRRNAFLGRLGEPGLLTEYAIRWVRAHD